MRTLQIENNEICDKAADSIAQAISCNTRLENFNNQFSTGCIIKIIEALLTISTLTKLYISNSNVTNEAVDGLAAVICKNTKLQKFDVSKNKIESIGTVKITKALRNIFTLRKLYVNNIYLIIK